MKFSQILKISLLLAVFVVSSCNDDDENVGVRTPVDYSVLTPETPYSQYFPGTVDFTEGNILFAMFYSMNNYMSSKTSANQQINADQLQSMFTNSGSPFSDIENENLTIGGEALNSSSLAIRDFVASSLSESDAEAERTTIESYFDDIDEASLSITETAAQGQAGKLGTRLVDARGIEVAQVIQKALIGALQLDYISNVLLDEGLTADNSSAVSGKIYTQLEHNWDMAYGLLTLNQVYLKGSTSTSRGTYEFGAGSYIWEYNKDNFGKIYPAFLKGRAAIVNKDMTTLQAQATLIRTEFEKTLAMAALGYLEKAKTDATDADRAHHLGEGLGFIYSLRYATIHGADAAFSDEVLNTLIGSENGFWDLNETKINAASDAIQQQFGL